MNLPDENTAPPHLFDRPRIAKRLARAWNGEPDFVTALILEDLAQRLSPIKRHFKNAYILGPEPRALPTKLASADDPIELTPLSTLLDIDGFAKVDPEALTLPDTQCDLIISLLDLHIVDDVPGYLSRVRQHLAPDGLMIAAAIGGRSLTELRTAWLEADLEAYGGAFVRVAPFMDVRDAGGLLQRAGFALPVADMETHKVRYANPIALMGELRTLGASNPMAEQPHKLTHRSTLLDAAGRYVDQFEDSDGRIPASLEILWLSGWAPDESQQKPLKPGSATTHLSEILPDKS